MHKNSPNMPRGQVVGEAISWPEIFLFPWLMRQGFNLLTIDSSSRRAGFPNHGTVDLGARSFCVTGTVLYIAGWLPMSLASTHEMPVATLHPRYDNQNISRHFQVSLGSDLPQLRTSGVGETGIQTECYPCSPLGSPPV